MPATAFIFEEITGSRRSITLSGRALPYQEIGFPVSQKSVTIYYPGNQVGTQQVLGPEVGDVKLKGVWKSRFLLDPNPEVGGSEVRLEGFDDIPNEGGAISAEDLVRAFRRITIAGNTTRLEWAGEVRIGTIHQFTPTYLRVEDIEWELLFRCQSIGLLTPVRAAEREENAESIRRALDELDAARAEEPPGLLDRARTAIREAIAEYRAANARLADILTQIQTSATLGTALFQNALTQLRRVIQIGQALKTGTLDLPYIDLLPFDAVENVFSAQNWKSLVGQQTRNVVAVSTRAVDNVSRRAVPGVRATIIVRENETLRLIALQFYDDADAWPIIADANDLVGSDVPAGTVLIIPEPPANTPSAPVNTGTRTQSPPSTVST